jgi:hypothetical protein
MITNPYIGSDGRLGNQLFQYAALKSLALKKKYDFVLPVFNDKSSQDQSCLLNNFNLDCPLSDLNSLTNTYIEPTRMHTAWTFNKIANSTGFDHNFFNLSDNTSIRGFFQHLKYFIEYDSIFRKEFTLKQSIILKAKNILLNYRKKFPDYKFVSVHIRRGDVVFNPTMFKNYGEKMYGSDITRLCPNSVYGQYFLKAKKYFDYDYSMPRVKFLVFVGGNRHNELDERQWFNNSFLGDSYIYASTDDPLVDFSLISQCDYNILCHGSSFGWWATYLSEETNEKVMIAPSDYFVDGHSPTRILNYRYTLI